MAIDEGVKPLQDGIKEHRLSSWKEFITIIGELADYKTYIYRGQRKADWKLVSSLDRLVGKLHKRDNRGLRNRHLECFKKAICGRRGSNPPTLSAENDWWVLGQQHGLATPLLDWTESPFVALFFAFEEPSDSEDDDRVVFAISENSIQEKKRIEEIEYEMGADPASGWPSDDRRGAVKRQIRHATMAQVVRSLSDENRNLVSQRGLFTYCPYIPLENWVGREFKDENEKITLFKWIIPNGDRNGCLQLLNKMNINHLTLFPDLYGASKYCNMNLQIDNY